MSLHTAVQYIQWPVGTLPQLSWYDELELPSGRTYEVTERVVRNLDDVNREAVGHEQGGNSARSVGRDHVNKDLIKNNILVNGLLVSVQPGYLYNDDLYDGFTRYDAELELGYTHAVFNKVTLKDGFTEEEMRDEIGLGANNHPPSKAATIGDFKVRLTSYVDNYEIQNNTLPSMGDCIDWMNNIDHSFMQKQVIDLAETVLKSKRCSKTVSPFSSKDVTIFAATNADEDVNKVIPLNISTQKGGRIKQTYFDRAIAAALPHAGDAKFIAFTQGIEAVDIPRFRQLAQDQVDAANDAFERAFQKRLEEGKSFKMFKIEGYIPQIIGEEEASELIRE